MLQAGAMVNDVAQHFGCSRQTIHHLNHWFAITGSVRDHPRPGQRRVTSDSHCPPQAARLLWAQRNLHSTCRQWLNVIFSDESRFSVNHADGSVREYRRKNERYAQCCVREQDRLGDGSVMVWGGIMGNDKTDLVVGCTGYSQCSTLC